MSHVAIPEDNEQCSYCIKQRQNAMSHLLHRSRKGGREIQDWKGGVRTAYTEGLCSAHSTTPTALNCLQLLLQGIQCPLLESVGTAHIYINPHADIHVHIIYKTSFRNLEESVALCYG